MEILIFLLVISNLNLVLTEDVAIDNTAPLKDNNKAHITPEKHFPDDQLAESSQSITQVYGNAVVSDDRREIHDGTQNHVQIADKPTDGLRPDAVALSPIRVFQQDLPQGYVQPQQTQQLYLHRFPVQHVQIFGAQASPLQQTQDDRDPQALGYSSYVEHLSEKDEDEIKSALKDGSVSDIKRLVPKSGITFKIYQNDKSVEKENQAGHFGPKNPAGLSVLHHRIRGESPATPVRQVEVYQPATSFSDGNGEEHEGSEFGQQLLQSQGHDQQQLYYAQSTEKSFPDANEKSSSFARPHFKINVAEGNYNQQTTAAELHRNLISPGKNSKQRFSDASGQKQRNFAGKTDVFQRGVKPVKTVETLHYAAEPLAQPDDSKGLSYVQNHGSGSVVGDKFNKHTAENSYTDTAKYDSGNYLSNSYVAKTGQNFAGQFVSSDHKLVLNRLSGNYVSAEGIKPGQVAHLGTTAYADHAFKSGRFAADDSETAKSGQHGLITDLPKNAYLEIKNSQNFDHQKALEGSTPFDIKNAIDSSGSFLHQTNYINPTTEIHPLENVQKQQLAYVIPKLPTSTVVIDNSIHDAVAEGHQNKDFGASPQVSYHPAAEIGGQFLHPSQTLLWTSDHFKQGHALTSKDLHQQLLRLHLPKEEVYVKTSNVEFPLRVVSHVSPPQQKQQQPLAFHYDFPVVKAFPHELHFQQKTKTRVQPGQISHFKLAQPVSIDWSLFKSGSSGLGLNALGVKPELLSHGPESGKKIVPILVRRRKNRSNAKQEVGVVYGKVNAGGRPTKPIHRQEKNVRGNVLTEANSRVKHLEAKGERKNEFSVSASYKVDRSSKVPN